MMSLSQNLQVFDLNDPVCLGLTALLFGVVLGCILTRLIDDYNHILYIPEEEYKQMRR